MAGRVVVDILVSGGGIAGLSAAAAFGAAGFRTLCVDPAPAAADEADPGADLRTTALLQPATELLHDIGIWPRLAPLATALRVMRIVELTDAVSERHDFVADEISDQPFGWNLPNWLLRRELLAHLAGLPGVELRQGTATNAVLTRTTAALATLSDGTQVAARLLVAADGRESAVRKSLGIGVRTLRYGQTALAFAVTHALPHGNVSTEIHRDGGPFTLVPLPDRDGRPCSAVVWMERTSEAQRLAALPEAGFEEAMADRSGGIYGRLSLATRRSLWPIRGQIADRFSGERTALMAEAAHVVPPIGAQGLNMSLADLHALHDLATARPQDLGSQAMLDAYERRRRPEALARVAAIDLLNRTSMAGGEAAQKARARALALLHRATPVRQALMRLGMGLGRP